MEEKKQGCRGLVAFDLDRTLLDHESWRITPSALESIAKLRKNGYLIALATGRDMKNELSRPYLQELDPDALIHMNGTLVELRDQVLVDRDMDRSLLRRALSFAFLHQFALGARIDEQDYFTFPEQVQEFDRQFWGFRDRHFQDPMKLLELRVRSLVYYGAREKAEELQYAFPELNVLMFAENLGADVCEAAFSKAEGIKRVCQHYGIDPSCTYAFGDGMNDLEMLKKAAVGIAMGNAVEPVKAAADYVTDNIEEDGIAHALQHFGLI